MLIFLVPIVAAKVGPVADGTHRLCKGGGVFLLVFLTQTLRGGFAPAGVTQRPLSHAEKGVGLSRHPQGARAEGSSQGLTHAVRADSKKKGLDKISAEQLRCLARLQRHARAQAWPAGGPPWPFGLGAAILHGFTVTERRQRNGLNS